MPGSIFRTLTHSLTTLSSVAYDLVHFLILVARFRRLLAAENLYLRKQLALFQERRVKPRRANDSTRLVMVLLGRMFSWRNALNCRRPQICSHRDGWSMVAKSARASISLAASNPAAPRFSSARHHLWS